MPSLADVFRVVERMRDAGLFDEYAIGGATAALFYAEPVRTRRCLNPAGGRPHV